MRRIITSALAGISLLSASAASEELRLNTQDFAPFNYAIDGVVAGPAAEIINRVCEEIRVTCTLNLLPWRRAQEEVKEGRAHGMFVIGWNEARHSWVHFSPPILKTEYGFFVRADDPLEYRALEDVAGRTVAVFGPSNTSHSLAKLRTKMVEKGLRPITIDLRPDDEAGIKKLVLGRVDAVFSNRDVGFALAAKLGYRDQVRYAGKTRELNYYIGFAAAHTKAELLAKFDAALGRLESNGEVRKVLDKYGMLSADPKLIPEKLNKR